MGATRTKIRKTVEIDKDFPMNLIYAIDEHWEYTKPDDLMGTVLYVIDQALSNRERDIILMRYMLTASLDDCGHKFDITRERVRQIEAKALKKLSNQKYLNYYIFGMEGIMNRNAMTARSLGENHAMRTAIGVLTNMISADENDNSHTAAKLSCDMTFEEAGMSIRATNCFKRAGMRILGDLIDMNYEELTSVKNLGKRCYTETIAKLKEYGLHNASMDPPKK